MVSERRPLDVVVVGGAYTDYVARGPRLPGKGEDVRGDVFHEFPGGKGFNQAVAAARLGARVAFVGCIGADARGDALAAALAREGVDTWHVLRTADAHTGAALIHVDQRGNNQILVATGANRCLTAQDVAAAAPVLTATNTLLVQLEVPLGAVEAAVVLAADAGARIVLDPAPPRRLPGEVLSLVDIIKPNATEAQALSGVAVHDRASAHQAADVLLKHGVRAVAVQAGDEGNLVVWREGTCFLPALEVERVDTTGAGDAFAASLAVLLAEGRSLEEAGPFANAAAALASTVLGAYPSMPHRDDVAALLARSDSSTCA
jgi:ribokinase